MKLFVCAVCAYLIGSFCASIPLSRKVFGDDVRRHGSGNAGATNMARVYGMKAGLATLALDMLKTIAAMLIGKYLGGTAGMAIAGAFCIIGHCFPLYFGFRGGKGVSVSGCIALLLDWRMFLIIVAVFGVAAVLSGRVSLGSVTAALAYPWAYLLLPGNGIDSGFWVCCLVMVLVIFLHRANIGRLLRGTEPKFKPGGKKKDEKTDS